MTDVDREIREIAELSDNPLEERIRRQIPHYGFYPGGANAHFVSEVNWHWHGEYEFGYVAEGSILYKTSRSRFILHSGEAIFINSGVLHYLQPLEEGTRLYTQFIDGAFLAEPGSFADERYLRPVAEKRRLDAFPIRRADGEEALLDGLEEGIRLAQERAPFYEFRLKGIFLSVWERVYARASAELLPEEKTGEESDRRVKEMILYIQQHFQEEIAAADIAHFAHVSERECYRLFKGSLEMTPIEFLFSVRIRRAQEMLMRTDKSVLDIALEAGFSSSSYFGKRFREQCGISPGQFRKRYWEMIKG